MSSAEPEVVCVSPDGKYTLFKQADHGKNNIVDDPWMWTGHERVEMTLKPCRDRNDPWKNAKILAIYTTENEDKIECLRNLLKDIVNIHHPGLVYQLEDKSVKTPGAEGKVGKQPFAPYGQLGNLYRIEEAFEKELATGDPNSQYDPKDYLAIFILSIESDIDDKAAVPYDRPNMMVYECFSKNFIAGVGCGPGAQTDLLEIAKKQGIVDGNDRAGKYEYGHVLADNFGVDSADWHRTVSDHNRLHYFKRLSETILSEAQNRIQYGQLHFHLPDKDDKLND